MIDSCLRWFSAPYLTGIMLVVKLVVDFLYCLVCLREISITSYKNQNMEEIQGGHCPCSKIQGGQPTTLPPPWRAPVVLDSKIIAHAMGCACRKLLRDLSECDLKQCIRAYSLAPVRVTRSMCLRVRGLSLYDDTRTTI